MAWIKDGKIYKIVNALSEAMLKINMKAHEERGWKQVGEVAQAMQSEMGWGKPTDANNLYEELIHVAAVSVAIAEQIKELEN